METKSEVVKFLHAKMRGGVYYVFLANGRWGFSTICPKNVDFETVTVSPASIFCDPL